MLQTGIGQQAVDRALNWLLPLQPGIVVVAGFCGSLVPEWKVGALVQPDEMVEDSEPVRLPDTRCVRLVTVNAPVRTVAERLGLHARTGAGVVDMESTRVAHRCLAAQVPFHILRIVTDDLEHPLPEDLFDVVDGEKIKVLGLLKGVIHRPGLLLDLVRLARQTRSASWQLAEALVNWLGKRGSGR